METKLQYYPFVHAQCLSEDFLPSCQPLVLLHTLRPLIVQIGLRSSSVFHISHQNVEKVDKFRVYAHRRRVHISSNVKLSLFQWVL